MQTIKADLHIHTVLSPCADLAMSPANIVQEAKEARLGVIGITDHNSTRNARVVKNLAEKEGILVLTGAEVTTKEEVHCLTFFEKEEELIEFQKYLDDNIVQIDNPDGYWGYQPVVDKDENILELVPYWLPAALETGISAIQKKVYSLNGIFIPAHISRPENGIFAQLGFIPSRLEFDALEITGRRRAGDIRKKYKLKKEWTLIRNSDAHFPQQTGRNYSFFHIEKADFSEIKMALNRQKGRFVEIV